MFANRIINNNRSFINEILRVIGRPGIISFAGGLPNPQFFPIHEIRDCSNAMITEDNRGVFQYASTNGHPALRQKIADLIQQQRGIMADPDRIIITSGSQQGLDLVSRIFLNPGDKVMVEAPSYLGAIQALDLYEPRYVTINQTLTGLDIDQVKTQIDTHPGIKFFYTNPNFQNPTGLSWTATERAAVADAMAGSEIVLVEDDPYGELRFEGERIKSLKNWYPDTILLGSFSKIFAPAFRLGWIYADNEAIYNALITVKQAADLHTNSFSQRLLDVFLESHDINAYIKKISTYYKKKRDVMLKSLKQWMPEGVVYSRPEGGMFIWCKLPDGFCSQILYYQAIEAGVAFVPGAAFYVSSEPSPYFRLNYTNSENIDIDKGIQILSELIRK